MNTKITTKIALSLMISSIATVSHAMERKFAIANLQHVHPELKQRPIQDFKITNEQAIQLVKRPEILNDFRGEVDLTQHDEVKSLLEEMQKETKASGRQVLENASVLGPIVVDNYGGVASKEDFYLLPEVEQFRLKEEVKIARSAKLDLKEPSTANTFVQMRANPQLAGKISDPEVVKVAYQEVKDGHALNDAVIIARVELSKSGCPDNSVEALAALGHINADDLTHVKFVDGQAGYVGGDKNLNIQTLAALSKMAHADNDPALADFNAVRDVITIINEINASKEVPPISITGGLATIALHVNAQPFKPADERAFIAMVLGYHYLVNHLGIARADLDANQPILAAFKDSMEDLEQKKLVNPKANDIFAAADRNIAAAAIQLHLTPALAGRATVDDVTTEDLHVVAELFKRVGIHIGSAAGLGFDAADVNALAHLVNLDDTDGLGIDPTNAHQHAAVKAMQNAAFVGGAIAKPSAAEVMQFEALRGAGIARTKNNVKASVYLSNLDDTGGLGIDAADAGQIAAVIAMQDAGFVGGTIEKPSAAEVMEYERMRVAGIALTNENVKTSVILQYGFDGGAQVIADPDQQDIEASIEISTDARALGIKPAAYKAPFIAAVKHLKNIGGKISNNYTRANISATLGLQTQIDPEKNAGVLGPVGLAAPAKGQIKAVSNAASGTGALVSWKIQKEEAAGHGNYIPGAVVKFIRADDGAGHAEFEVVYNMTGGLTAAARVAADNKIKVDPATLANLPDGRGGTAAPQPNRLYVIEDLQVDGADVARVTFDNPDARPTL